MSQVELIASDLDKSLSDYLASLDSKQRENVAQAFEIFARKVRDDIPPADITRSFAA